MKIEIVIALILGTALGIGGMFFVAQLMNETPKAEVQTNIVATATPTTTTEVSKNELITPNTFTSWDTSPLPLKGSVKGGNFAFLLTDTTDTIIPLTNGKFDITTPPLLGVAGYRFYSAFGDKIGESVVVSFKDLPQNKKMRFGVVTDLTAESIQMRGNDGIIDQVAYASNVVVGSFIKDSKKITTADVAIGDKVIIVGDTAEKNGTLASGVFVIPSDFGLSEYILKTGNITSINKSDVVISTKDGDLGLKTTAETKYFGVKDTGVLRKRTKLIQSDTTRVAYVTFVKDSTSIRSIFISE